MKRFVLFSGKALFSGENFIIEKHYGRLLVHGKFVLSIGKALGKVSTTTTTTNHIKARRPSAFPWKVYAFHRESTEQALLSSLRFSRAFRFLSFLTETFLCAFP